MQATKNLFDNHMEYFPTSSSKNEEHNILRIFSRYDTFSKAQLEKTVLKQNKQKQIEKYFKCQNLKTPNNFHFQKQILQQFFDWTQDAAQNLEDDIFEVIIADNFKCRQSCTQDQKFVEQEKLQRSKNINAYNLQEILQGSYNQYKKNFSKKSTRDVEEYEFVKLDDDEEGEEEIDDNMSVFSFTRVSTEPTKQKEYYKEKTEKSINHTQEKSDYNSTTPISNKKSLSTNCCSRISREAKKRSNVKRIFQIVQLYQTITKIRIKIYFLKIYLYNEGRQKRFFVYINKYIWYNISTFVGCSISLLLLLLLFA